MTMRPYKNEGYKAIILPPPSLSRCMRHHQEQACLCRSLYGECIFSAHTQADLQLADELLQATASSAFTSSVKTLAAGFNRTILPYETAYFAAMSNGASALRCYLRHAVIIFLEALVSALGSL